MTARADTGGRPRTTSRLSDAGGRFVVHLDTVRPDLVFYSGLVSLGGALVTALAAGITPSIWVLIGAWVAPTLGWFAAMYGGDYFDRDLDAIAKPQRPIPSGLMRPRTALLGMIANILAGLVIAVLLNPWNALVVIVTAALGIAYSKRLKARGVWGNVVRGAITAMAFLFGMLAVSPTPELLLLPLALVFWLHDSASNVVGAMCDAEGDRAGGYRTFPVRHGEAASLRLLIALHVAWIVLAVGWPLFLQASGVVELVLVPYFVLLAVAVAMTVVSTVMLVRSTRPIHRVTALRSHELIVLERLGLACALICAATSLWIGVAVLVPSVLGTLLASVAMMRHRYEPSRGRTRRAEARA